MIDNSDAIDALRRKIKLLHEGPWEGRVTNPELQDWLSNFSGTNRDEEEFYALYLLSNFMYFGDWELRELLRSLFRDKYKHPTLMEIRSRLHNTRDTTLLDREFSTDLMRTRFLGMGNPAESGAHLLYYFRQENHLEKDLFIDPHQIFDGPVGSAGLRDKSIKRYIFIDDFCGSGSQALDYSAAYLSTLKKVARSEKVDVTISYYVLFGTSSGVSSVRQHSLFDEIECLCPLDESYKVFGPDSRYFTHSGPIDKRTALRVCRTYGGKLVPSGPLGFSGGQLLLGFHHNVPDNTLPIFWFEDANSTWKPIFSRYQKVYGP